LLKNEGDRLTRVVVCSPEKEYFNVADPKLHNIKEAADPHRAIHQHAELRLVLRNFGSEVINAAELEGHPNSVFTRDMSIVTPQGYIKLRMGLRTREGEEEYMARFLDSIGEPCAGEIFKPGTVEGGDIFLCGSVAFVGESRRTNEEGIRQLSRLLEKMGYEVRALSLPETYLHLDQTIGVLGPNHLIYCRELYPRALFDGFEATEFSCAEFNVNFICLGPGEILAPAANTKVIQTARSLGVKVNALDVSEFAKGKGGPNCLVLPLERQ